MKKSDQFDQATAEWFRQHPFAQTTVMKCENCGLVYKPILGHKCKKLSPRNANNKTKA